MTTDHLNRWRVVRKSTTTGRVLKVLARGIETPREAELFAEGFGKDSSRRTIVDWEREPSGTATASNERRRRCDR